MRYTVQFASGTTLCGIEVGAGWHVTDNFTSMTATYRPFLTEAEATEYAAFLNA